MESRTAAILTAKDERFLQSFEAAAIPFGEWKHRTHLKVAVLYLRRFPLDMAIARMRDGIKALNAAHGTADAPDRGYHETMTVAWMRLVHFTLGEYGSVGTADQFLDEHPELLSRHMLRFYYSRDRILSWEAKEKFLEPDLAEFPKSRPPPPPKPLPQFPGPVR